MLYVYVVDAEDPKTEAITVIEYEPEGVIEDESAYNVVEQEDPLVVHEEGETEHVIPEGAEQEKVTVVEILFGLFKLAVAVEFVWVPGQTEEELDGFNWTDKTETEVCMEILGITPFGGYALTNKYWKTALEDKSLLLWAVTNNEIYPCDAIDVGVTQLPSWDKTPKELP